MARRVFVHIGTPKSGTTYLQSLWWHHRAALAAQGLLLPGGSADEQFRGCAVVRDNAGVLATMSQDQRGAWDRMLDEVAGFAGDALISQEQLVETSRDDAAAALARLGGASDEVHLVITVRDLVRQVPSAWQQRVKHGSPTTLRTFFTRVAKDDPTFNFWHHQDVPRILERWAGDLSPDHVHLVVLPRPGAEADLLWRRTCELLGIDDTGLSLDAPAANETLAPAEIAFVRGVNAHFRNAHLDVALSRRVKGFMEPRLLARPASGPTPPSPWPPTCTPGSSSGATGWWTRSPPGRGTWSGTSTTCDPTPSPAPASTPTAYPTPTCSRSRGTSWPQSCWRGRIVTPLPPAGRWSSHHPRRRNVAHAPRSGVSYADSPAGGDAPTIRADEM